MLWICKKLFKFSQIVDQSSIFWIEIFKIMCLSTLEIISYVGFFYINFFLKFSLDSIKIYSDLVFLFFTKFTFYWSLEFFSIFSISYV